VGYAFDDAHGACVPITEHDAGTLLDLGRWIGTVVGPDGGEASSDLCRRIAEAPRRAALTAHGKMVIRLTIELDLPDGDVTALVVGVRARAEPGDRPLTGSTLSAVQLAVSSLTEPLRADGPRQSNAAHATTTVDCAVSDLVSPVAGRQRSFTSSP
jgi:hypothetical protein